MMDIIIIGGGPAGLTAAIYAKRAGCNVSVFEKMAPGGQVMTTPEIENYPGFTGTGFDLSMNMFEQVNALGVSFEYETIERIENKDGLFYVYTESQKEFTAKSVIIASGAKRRLLGIDGEKEFTGRGVSYCATCDGNFFKEKTAVVVGGGNTAVEDAIYLSKLCEKVYIIHRRDEFRASKVLVDRMKANEKIEVVLNTVPVEISGDDKVNKIIVKNKITDEQSEIETDAVFVAIGTVPETSFVSDLVTYDNAGYIQTDEKCMTQTKGLFAVGDVRNTLLKQIITAAADGAVAANFAAEYVQTIDAKKE
ncbi:MAG: thioredoxin-disulfide reductase [Ruminococcaceae bacterium]|nr:thioredoxin-disulfide reductase [Oscillospiraceae bacterium]